MFVTYFVPVQSVFYNMIESELSIIILYLHFILLLLCQQSSSKEFQKSPSKSMF